jgi:dTMP kinase
MQIKKGKFIVLEGIDGCGKDTQQDMLSEVFNHPENLEKYGEFVNVRVLDEGDEKQKRLREVVFNPNFRFDTNAEIFLFWADKLSMAAKIKEAINAGKNVLVNRWELSQYAYQIYGKQREDLRDITEKVGAFIEKDMKPDLYILFDISPEESQKRKHVRTGETGKFEDYYDNAKADFFERVIYGYKTEIKKYPHVIINGEQSKEKVFKDTKDAIEKCLNQG